MIRFIRLRPKLYSFDYEREANFNIDKNGVEKEVKKPTATSLIGIVLDNKNTAKGVTVKVAKKLSFENYECCLWSLSPKRTRIFTGCFPRVRRRLDYLPLIPRGGYAMMVLNRMHLDTERRYYCKLFMLIYVEKRNSRLFISLEVLYHFDGVSFCCTVKTPRSRFLVARIIFFPVWNSSGKRAEFCGYFLIGEIG